MAKRPNLSAQMEERSFLRWYWTMAELQPFARSLHISAAGPKAELTARIAARLGGHTPPQSTRRTPTAQLTAPLTLETLIPVGQRSSEDLRSFFLAEIGPTFRFNGHMRSFLLTGNATLADAVRHWYRTVGTPLPEQSKSLEFNAFTKAWHSANPDGTADECRQAWSTHRSLPIDER